MDPHSVESLFLRAYFTPLEEDQKERLQKVVDRHPEYFLAKLAFASLEEHL